MDFFKTWWKGKQQYNSVMIRFVKGQGHHMTNIGKSAALEP